MQTTRIPLTANVRIVSGQFAGKYGRLTGDKMYSNIHQCTMLQIAIGRKGRELLVYVPEFRCDRFTKNLRDELSCFSPLE